MTSLLNLAGGYFDFDSCKCSCHRYPPGTVMHCIPCCYPKLVPVPEDNSLYESPDDAI